MSAPVSLRSVVVLLAVAAIPGAVTSAQVPAPGTFTPTTTPDYFGVYGNYAYSPVPVVDSTGAVVPGTGLRKFLDPLPRLDQGTALAVPEACTFSGQAADCYTIKLKEVTWQFHADLPATRLRGYVQVLGGVDQPYNYLGPVIVSSRNKPVRVTFVNALPTGAGGDLFIPTDTTYMGAGAGPNGGSYPQNRATLHLHGGTTPWISDGTVHQWTTPSGETTAYPQGVSVYNVPDMANPGKTAQQGTLTFFYTNQQSARLMFYHDHALGITRLNVYGGEAAGYLVTDPTEQALITAGTLPGIGIPLVIQDRTFVPESSASLDPRNTTGSARPFSTAANVDANGNPIPFPSQLEAQDPTWNTAKWGGFGSLWYPHVYMPNQNPGDLSGANAMGRWDYGPWFWPPFTQLTFGPVGNPYYDPNCVSGEATYCEGPQIPGTPDSMRSLSGVNGPSGVPEAFMDTPVVNGKAYPTLTVPAGKVRFRILNAANDRFWNLSWWQADAAATYPAGYDGPGASEVKMVPFNSTQNAAAPFPKWWYDSSVPNPFDDRVGGVPDPATRGPAWIQVGTEGGFLPAPAVVKNQPVNYVMNKRDITVGNVREKALFLGPAERADVVVDFSRFAGKTLILYSDSPAPVPAADPRLDYFTGDGDNTDTGGAPSTLAGYGPNTRTIMKVVVDAGADSSAPVDDYDATYLAALQTALPQAFAASQDPIIVPQAPYNAVYGGTFPGDASAYVKIQDTAFTFRPLGATGTGSCVTNPTGCVTVSMYPKSIIEDFQIDYGRMNAILGNEIPNTNVTNQTSIPQTLVDPPVEMVKLTDPSMATSLIGTNADGTQVWKITHNGVDTHAIHFHMFNVQVINRIGWDGAIKPPDANELGFKDTVRMNPLEDVVVATRPIRLTNVPFKIPNSIRLLNPTAPTGDPSGFTNVDPSGTPVTVVNQLANFGWEYVYHCHLLGHEENDMMRPLVIAAPPEAPTMSTPTVTGTGTSRRVRLAWTDNSLTANGFTIQKATNAAFTTGLATFGPLGAVATFIDPTPYPTSSPAWYYRMFASNTVGSNVPGYPTLTADSSLSNTVNVGGATAPSAPRSLAATIQSATSVRLTWTNTATNATNVVVQSSTNGSAFATIATLAATATSYTATGLSAGNTYRFQVLATNAVGSSAPAGPVTVTLATPSAPTNLTATLTSATVARLAWTNTATNATNVVVQRSTNGGAFTTVATLGATTTSYNAAVTAGNTYRFQVMATNVVGSSAPAGPVSVTVAVPAAPATFTAAGVNVNATTDSVVFTWSAVPGATSYTIEGAADAAFTIPTGSIPNLTGTTFTQTGVPRGATLYLRIRAVNVVGSSTPLNATPFPLTTP